MALAPLAARRRALVQHALLGDDGVVGGDAGRGDGEVVGEVAETEEAVGRRPQVVAHAAPELG